MICQTTDPTKMLDTLASLITKDGSVSDALAFVPTRRAARALERILSERAGGAALLPKIVGLGEGIDEDEEVEAVGNAEIIAVMAKLLLPVAERIGIRGGFPGVLPVAAELAALRDHLENEGIDARTINWTDIVGDERKAAFLDIIKDVGFGRPTAAQKRNADIAGWKKELQKYGRVFCCGSTASVKSTRDLMAKIAKSPNGTVILPGLLQNFDDLGRTDPYWSIKRFVRETGEKITTLDVGDDSKIRFFNECFGNGLSGKELEAPAGATEIECASESEEAAVAAAITAVAKKEKKSVLIITPDSAGGQRLRAAMPAYGLSVDSSGGAPLSQTDIGRFAGLLLEWVSGVENRAVVAADLAKIADFKDESVLGELRPSGGVPAFITGAMEKLGYKISDPAAAGAFFDKMSELSDIEKRYGLDFESSAALAADMLKKSVVRNPAGEYDAAVLGTAEARMQTADVVILTGLNDGMFPGDGFRHGWLSKSAAEKIGLPSSDAKVSLMALDFMTLSCGEKVYWTRSKMSGGAATAPSRFLSRVGVRAAVGRGADVLAAVRARNDVLPNPIDRTPPVVKYDGVYYATWLEDLIHNPYKFYAERILHLRERADIGDGVGAREFGIMIHSVLENCAKDGAASESEIEDRLTEAALKLVGGDSVLFRFWRNRFAEIAPVVSEIMSRPAEAEKEMETLYFGRRLIARADRIEDGRCVMDYKTGGIPSDKQLGLGKDGDCTMPQLPVEALILRENTGAPVSMAFLRLQKKRVGLKEYDSDRTAEAIAAAEKKLKFLFAMDSYPRPEHHLDEKYAYFDDLCRVDD